MRSNTSKPLALVFTHSSNWPFDGYLCSFPFANSARQEDDFRVMFAALQQPLSVEVIRVNPSQDRRRGRVTAVIAL